MTAPHHAHPRMGPRLAVTRWSRRVRAGLAAAASLALVASLAAVAPAAPAAAQPAAATQPAAGDHSPDSTSPDASPDVEAQLHSELADGGETDFWVYLDDAEPQLSPAAGIADRAEQGEFVHEELTSTAARSQEGLIALLEAAGADHRAFWIANTVRVTGDQDLLERILTLPGVAEVTADREYRVQQAPLAAAQPSASDFPWNLDDIEAPRAWDEFDATGEDIVVGTIDSGVQYDHPALVEQYRGTVDDGEFDHDHNWYDPSQVCPGSDPCDNTGHGTHVTGTMVGDDGGTNRIGVAPDAEWIAAKGCEAQNCSQEALLAAGQFMLAPTDRAGENPDPALRPHVVNNSWGGAADADPWYRPTVEAWEAAGIFPQFASGNTQFGTAPCGSVGNPGNLPESYTAGAYDSDGNIAEFSNRGPSAWDSAGVKPNIAAPGVAVRSAEVPDTYGTRNGTSMASPHVSGVVALMWSAADAIQRDIAATRDVLDLTARDTENLTCGGEPDNNNVWGEGRLDAYAAVDQSPRGPTGTLQGSVTDASDGEPISGADVTITGPAYRERTTGPDGTFSFILPVGEYEVAASTFGYEDTTVSEVVVTEQQTTDVDVALPRLPQATVAGTMVDANDDAPVADVQVRAYLDGEQVGQDETGADGEYALELPLGTYQLEVERTHYEPEQVTVTLDEGQEVVTADFTLRTADVVVSPQRLDPVLPVGAHEQYAIGVDNQGSIDAAFQVELPGRPWASVDTTGGTLEPGDSTQLTLEFDTTWMDPGTYPLTLSVTSNSGRQPVVELPMELHVPEVESIQVSPAAVLLRPNDTRQHEATARLADGTTMDVTDWAEWRSSDHQVVEVDENGLATAVGGIFATVTATLGEHRSKAYYVVAGLPVRPPGPPHFPPEPPESEREWQPTSFGPGVDRASVRSSVVWDDGNGPALYVGGDFRTAGEHQVNHVARWDGQQWQPLTGPHGTGVNDTVDTMAVHDGNLVVGGEFTRSGEMPVNYVAQWDGTEWSPLTGSLGAPGTSGPVDTVHEFEGDLLVGGAFANAGGVEANHVARWDGVDWSPLSGPDGDAGMDGVSVNALATFDGDLVAGGYFAEAGGVEADHIARWDGEQWAPLSGPEGSGVSSIVQSLAVYDGEVVAAGQFAEAGGMPVDRVAAWDGDRWRSLDGGVGGSRYSTVYALTVHEGDLLVGGSFPEAGDARASNIARWDGNGWSPMGEGTAGSVRTVTAYDGQLHVGGGFNLAGGEPVNSIATWDGEAWSSLAGVSAGVGGTVAAVEMFRDQPVVAGQFLYAGGDTVNHIARWDGEQWSPLEGPSGTGISGGVDALLAHDGDLFVAGQFWEAGGVPADRVARWDGEEWSPLGDGMDGRVSALAVYDGDVVAGGSFSQADGSTVDHVARWDGEEWSPLTGPDGTGVDGTNATVDTFTVHDGQLIVGGRFQEAGGSSVRNIARWDGEAWSSLSGESGAGVDGWVHDLAAHDGDLVAGGRFTEAGGETVDHIARWDGEAWSPLADGPDDWVRAVTVFDGDLVAGGRFTEAGGQTVNHVARWDGEAWSPLAGPAGTGVGDRVLALATQPGPGDAEPGHPGPDYRGPGRGPPHHGPPHHPDPDGGPSLVVGGWFSTTGGVANWGVGWYGPTG